MPRMSRAERSAASATRRPAPSSAVRNASDSWIGRHTPGGARLDSQSVLNSAASLSLRRAGSLLSIASWTSTTSKCTCLASLKLAECLPPPSAERRRDSPPSGQRLSGKTSEPGLEPGPAATCENSLPEDHPIESNVKSSLQYNRGCCSNQLCTHGTLGEGKEPDRTATCGWAGGAGEWSTAARAAARDAQAMGAGKSPRIRDSDAQAPTARATGQPPRGTTVCRAGRRYIVTTIRR